MCWITSREPLDHTHSVQFVIDCLRFVYLFYATLCLHSKNVIHIQSDKLLSFKNRSCAAFENPTMAKLESMNINLVMLKLLGNLPAAFSHVRLPFSQSQIGLRVECYVT